MNDPDPVKQLGLGKYRPGPGLFFWMWRIKKTLTLKEWKQKCRLLRLKDRPISHRPSFFVKSRPYTDQVKNRNTIFYSRAKTELAESISTLMSNVETMKQDYKDHKIVFDQKLQAKEADLKVSIVQITQLKLRSVSRVSLYTAFSESHLQLLMWMLLDDLKKQI